MNNMKFQLKSKSLNPKGFTLIEMLTVLALIGMMTGLVVINTHNLFDTKKENTPEEIFYSFLNRARLEVLKRKETLFIEFDEETRSFKLQSRTHSNPITEEKLPSDFKGIINFKSPKYNPGEESSSDLELASVNKIFLDPSNSSQRYIIEFEYENYMEQIQMDPLSNSRLVE